VTPPTQEKPVETPAVVVPTQTPAVDSSVNTANTSELASTGSDFNWAPVLWLAGVIIFGGTALLIWGAIRRRNAE
jgi:hypothetical protein